MEEHGEGEFTANDGGYYVGKWKDGRRDGFGFSVAPHEVVKCGVWAKGRFRGEQMLYHSERIYGIDISKYQHVHKRRVYGMTGGTCALHVGAYGRPGMRWERWDYPGLFRVH